MGDDAEPAHAPMPAGFQDASVAHLAALARSHDLLTRGAWEGASLLDIVEHTLAPHAARADGGGSWWTARRSACPPAAVTVNLAFQGPVTNAAKQSVLSVPEGCVGVR